MPRTAAHDRPETATQRPAPPFTRRSLLTGAALALPTFVPGRALGL